MTFLDVLTRSRITYKRRGSEIILACPFCQGVGETLNVNIDSGAGKCWHGSCSFRSRHAILAILRQLRVNITELDPDEAAPEVQEPVELPRDFQRLDRAKDDLDRQALNYLLRRGITRAQITERRIGVSFTGRYAFRVVLPNWIDKTLRGIVARDFTGHQTPKYLNSHGDKWLYGFDPSVTSCVLAEGVFKALRLESSGRRAAALLGHDLTDIQLEQIKQSALKEVILFPDPDKVGRAGVIKIADKLSNEWSGDVKIAWPVTVPADDMSLTDLRAVAVRSYDWLLQQKLRLNVE